LCLCGLELLLPPLLQLLEAGQELADLVLLVLPLASVEGLDLLVIGCTQFRGRRDSVPHVVLHRLEDDQARLLSDEAEGLAESEDLGPVALRLELQAGELLLGPDPSGTGMRGGEGRV